MSTVAWFHCFSGIAGDMALGALVDAGADLDEVLAVVRRVPVQGWTVEAEPVLRNGLAATRMAVRCQETAIVRTYSHIRGLLAEARLPPRVLDRSSASTTATGRPAPSCASCRDDSRLVPLLLRHRW